MFFVVALVFLRYAGRLAAVEEELEQTKAASERAQQSLKTEYEEVRVSAPQKATLNRRAEGAGIGLSEARQRCCWPA